MQWIKASDRKPVGKTSKERISIKYKGVPDVLIFWDNKWYWHDDDGSRRVRVHDDSWSAIEWLDESEDPVSIPLSIVEALVKENPWTGRDRNVTPHQQVVNGLKRGYEKAVSKLRELISVEKETVPDEFIKKHLAIIRDKTIESMIFSDIENKRDLLKGSLQHFISGGNCNGIFRDTLVKMLNIAYNWRAGENEKALRELLAAQPIQQEWQLCPKCKGDICWQDTIVDGQNISITCCTMCKGEGKILPPPPIQQGEATCAKNVQVQKDLPEVYLALKELVDLKETKEWLDEYPEDCTPEEREKRLKDYATRKPIAWEKAKNVMANSTPAQQGNVEVLRSALQEIISTNHDNHELVIEKVKQIASKALSQSSPSVKGEEKELKLTELPEPIGNFIIEKEKGGMPFVELSDGHYYHYAQVTAMLSGVLKSRFNNNQKFQNNAQP